MSNKPEKMVDIIGRWGYGEEYPFFGSEFAKKQSAYLEENIKSLLVGKLREERKRISAKYIGNTAIDFVYGIDRAIKLIQES